MKNKFFMIALLALTGFALIVCIAGCDRYGGINLNGDKEIIRISTQQIAGEIGETMDNYIGTLQLLSNEMSFYEDRPLEAPETRRREYENLMLSVFEESPKFFQLFTVWKPNAIDNMDARFKGRAGSTETGQFAFALVKGRETDQTEKQAVDSGVVQAAMAYLSGSNSETVDIDAPAYIELGGRGRDCFRIMVPILNDRTNEPVGVIGCQMETDILQIFAENKIRHNDEITTVVIYTNKGFILASYIPDRIGMKLADREIQYGDHINNVVNAVENAQEYECSGYDPLLRAKLFMCIAPVYLQSSQSTLSVMVGSTEAYIYRNVKAMGKTAVTILVIAGMIGILVFVIIIDRKKKKEGGSSV
jgi:methyl-accepting chemotaxis protein